MTRETATGDRSDALAQALADAGIDKPIGEIEALVRGVAAAAVLDRHWVRLVHPDAEATDALAARLEALRQAHAEAPNGIDTPQQGARLAALRGELARRGLDGFVVPLSDEHQGEYVARRSQRLAWLTGFTGSAGMAIVLAERAALFVDGRYTLQAAAQVDGSLYEHRHVSEEPADAWLREHLATGATLGYDPALHGAQGRDRLAAPCETVGARLVPCAENPVDALWEDQPPPPLGPIAPHPVRFAGRDAGEKRQAIAARLAEKGAEAAVLSAPDSIAWLLNVRGADVANSPLPHSFAIVHGEGAVDWFVDRRKLLPEVPAHLGNSVRVLAPDALAGALDGLAEAGKAVMVDGAATPVWMVDRLAEGGARVIRGDDPCALPKACKNEAELAGIRAAHRRDGAALTRFLAWLAAAPPNSVTELEAVDRLAAMRAGGEHFRGPSFDTISGAGPNGAIVHYRVTAETNRTLEPGTLYLVDSGGQYLDGTTDVTRTVAIGTPEPEHRDRFTRVLRGHIALATARFPRGTTGAQLDTLARQFLWQAGLDYDHGTGHGVGHYLNVHEGPQRISRPGSGAALRPGMVVSNEPGYYKTGAYGIRIENLVAVTEAGGSDSGFLGFETLTLAPIDRALIEPAMLTADERAWLDAYHARVAETLAPLLEDDAATVHWLEAATAPL
ncbi:MAG: aminopeptidase P family protein [Rhodospirillales bacterium]|nr:aminopeptidase P family protein [Rhodospirillales bacterium]MDE0380905.1 aminopeptidase P family protein [Rhodospirillales bacterium]